MEQLNVVTEDRAGAVVLRLTGSAGMWSVEDLQHAIEAVVARRPAVAVLELSGLEFVASLALGQFLRLATAQRDSGGRVAAAAATPLIEKALRRCRIDALVPMYPTLEAAIAGGPPGAHDR